MSLLILFNGGSIPSSMSARTDPITGILVEEGLTYSGMAKMRSATVARDFRLFLRWYDGNSALISTTTGATFTGSTSAWTQATVSATSPATATYVVLVLECLSVLGGEVHYWDKLGIFQGANPIWVPHTK